MTFSNCTLLSQELREHILHLRRELTRQDRSPLQVRQRLSQRLTDLLNQQHVVVAEVGFRRREKDSAPDDSCEHVCHRAPNDWELREFVIEPLVAIGLPGQHQQAGYAPQSTECGNPSDEPAAKSAGVDELENLREALALANERADGLERERNQALAELAVLKVPSAEPPEVVATLEIGDYQDDKSVYATLTKHIGIDEACADDRLMLVAQHERSLAALGSSQMPIAVISQPRSDADPDEGPFMEAHYWLRLRKLPAGTKLYTAPPFSKNLIGLLEAGNPLSNAAYSLAQKLGPPSLPTTASCSLSCASAGMQPCWPAPWLARHRRTEMTDKYATLRAALPELLDEARRRGGENPRAKLIADLLGDYDALCAALEAGPVAWQSRFVSAGDSWDAWQPCTKEHHELVTRTPNEWPGYETRAVCAYPAGFVLPASTSTSTPQFDLKMLQPPVIELLEFIFDRYRSPEAAATLPDRVVSAVRALEPFAEVDLENKPSAGAKALN